MRRHAARQKNAVAAARSKTQSQSPPPAARQQNAVAARQQNGVTWQGVGIGVPYMGFGSHIWGPATFDLHPYMANGSHMALFAVKVSQLAAQTSHLERGGKTHSRHYTCQSLQAYVKGRICVKLVNVRHVTESELPSGWYLATFLLSTRDRQS